MILLTVIIFRDSNSFSALSSKVCEKLSLDKDKEFPGCWDIVDNRKDVISSISNTINYFIETSDKNEIVFGCCTKDYSDIMQYINTDNCEINCTYADVFVI